MKAPVMGLTVLSVAALLAGVAFAAGEVKPAAAVDRKAVDEYRWKQSETVEIDSGASVILTK